MVALALPRENEVLTKTGQKEVFEKINLNSSTKYLVFLICIFFESESILLLHLGNVKSLSINI